MKPYYADDTVTLYHGDMREILPALDLSPDCIVADPPYGMLCRPDRGVGLWDIWPTGWVDIAAAVTSSMWCFGTMRTFLTRAAEYGNWQFSHDVVWSKGAGTGGGTDRFRPSHENVTHWYRGRWGDVYNNVPKVPAANTIAKKPAHRKAPTVINNTPIRTEWVDDGTRWALSVIEARNLNGRGIHPTEKPVSVLDLLVRYACPPGGLVLDPFAGSGSTAAAARLSGRRAVLIEADERYCDAIARRLAQDVLPLGGVV